MPRTSQKIVKSAELL